MQSQLVARVDVLEEVIDGRPFWFDSSRPSRSSSPSTRGSKPSIRRTCPGGDPDRGSHVLEPGHHGVHAGPEASPELRAVRLVGVTALYAQDVPVQTFTLLAVFENFDPVAITPPDTMGEVRRHDSSRHGGTTMRTITAAACAILLLGVGACDLNDPDEIQNQANMALVRVQFFASRTSRTPVTGVRLIVEAPSQQRAAAAVHSSGATRGPDVIALSGEDGIAEAFVFPGYQTQQAGGGTTDPTTPFDLPPADLRRRARRVPVSG